MDVHEPLTLACARVLESYTLVYETYGTLNADKSNAVLICHALSGHHHAAGYHHENETKAGWWDNCIGPNKAIDTNQFFVVALNNLGGCHGSSGPSSLNPETGRIYGPDFPLVTVRDWVQVQARLSDYRLLGGYCRWFIRWHAGFTMVCRFSCSVTQRGDYCQRT